MLFWVVGVGLLDQFFVVQFEIFLVVVVIEGNFLVFVIVFVQGFFVQFEVVVEGGFVCFVVEFLFQVWVIGEQGFVQFVVFVCGVDCGLVDLGVGWIGCVGVVGQQGGGCGEENYVVYCVILCRVMGFWVLL